MNTPTHLMLSLAALTRKGEPGERTYLLPAAAGALLPDAPMFAFYAIEKGIIGSSEREIWMTRYFLPAWQDFFDLFNSAPLVLAGMFLAWQFRRPAWLIFFSSMLLHIACDLPLHHDDGHRHFWPFMNWRYESPVSYWDPNRYGQYVMIAELALFFACYLLAMRKHTRLRIRIGLSAVTVIHLSFMALALVYWAGI